MKRFFRLSPVFLIVCIAFFTSCKKSSSSTIVGTWKSTGEHVVTVDSTTTPVTITTMDTTFTSNYPLVITFNADGSLSAISYGGAPESGTYFYGQGKISITTTGSSDPEIFGYTLSGNKFTLIETENSPGSSSITGDIIFTKE